MVIRCRFWVIFIYIGRRIFLGFKLLGFIVDISVERIVEVRNLYYFNINRFLKSYCIGSSNSVVIFFYNERDENS